MIVQKFILLRGLLVFAGGHMIWLSMYAILIAVLYKYAGCSWIAIPWVPIAQIGTAVAFYLGFKNSQAYDSMWEARKIWSAIVNSSFLMNTIFIILLPLSMVGELSKLGEAWVWLMIPFAILVSWVFIIVELVGDYSEIAGAKFQ